MGERAFRPEQTNSREPIRSEAAPDAEELLVALPADRLRAHAGKFAVGIGDGIAIPHVRNPVVLHVPRPSICLCFLEKPIDFDSIDGLPVFALFSMVSPTVRAHLHLLSRLSFALHDSGFKSVIMRQAPREEIMGAARQVEASLPGCVATPREGQ